jgi:hypothetical protein
VSKVKVTAVDAIGLATEVMICLPVLSYPGLKMPLNHVGVVVIKVIPVGE